MYYILFMNFVAIIIVAVAGFVSALLGRPLGNPHIRHRGGGGERFFYGVLGRECISNSVSRCTYTPLKHLKG